MGLTQNLLSDWVMMVMMAASPLPAVFTANTSTLGGGGQKAFRKESGKSCLNVHY